jgi:hypothetical protein
MRVRISFETRQDEVMQDSTTASDFERDVETVEEAWAFGYSVAQIHGSLFAGLTQGYQDQQQGEAGDEGEEG